MRHYPSTFWIWAAYMTLVCVFAVARGGLSERLGAVIIMFGWFASVIVTGSGWWLAPMPSPLFVVDSIVLALLLALAFRSRRFWPLWAAGFHLLAVAVHGVKRINPGINPLFYVRTEVLMSYLMVAALAVGTWGAWRRRRAESRFLALVRSELEAP